MGASLPLSRHKLSIDEYHQMGRSGIFRDDSRVELIEGELIDMAPIGSLHASVVSTLSMLFARQAGDSAIVSTQNPISLPPDNEPQPDIALLKPSDHRYRNSLPLAADVLLIVEVADSSVEYDRQIKLPLYARNAIPEVWLIDLNAGILEIHLEPTDKGYRKLLRADRGETVAPVLLSEVRLPLDEVWPA